MPRYNLVRTSVLNSFPLFWLNSWLAFGKVPSLQYEPRTRQVRYIPLFTECQPVGVADPNRIPNNQMTANSYHDHSSGYYPYYGRLNEKRGAGAWCPMKPWNARTDYLQVDLGTEHFVCAVATQGSSRYNEWLTSYILLMSKDEVTWGTYKENNAEKVRW